MSHDNKTPNWIEKQTLDGPFDVYEKMRFVKDRYWPTNPEGAINYIDEVLKRHPDHFLPLFTKCDFMSNSKIYDGLIELCDKLLSLIESNDSSVQPVAEGLNLTSNYLKAEILIRKSIVYEFEKNEEELFRCWILAIEADSTHPGSINRINAMGPHFQQFKDKFSPK